MILKIGPERKGEDALFLMILKKFSITTRKKFIGE